MGYGVNILKKKTDDRSGRLTKKSDGVFYLVSIEKNSQGHLQVALMNTESINETGELHIYKVPEQPKFMK